MRECAAGWVPIPPYVKLMLCLDDPEAIMLAGHAATGCACFFLCAHGTDSLHPASHILFFLWHGEGLHVHQSLPIASISAILSDR